MTQYNINDSRIDSHKPLKLRIDNMFMACVQDKIQKLKNRLSFDLDPGFAIPVYCDSSTLIEVLSF